jgi:hypothetical protein
MPSASTWFMTMAKPVLPPATPVTNLANHSGRNHGPGLSQNISYDKAVLVGTWPVWRQAAGSG